MHPKPPLSLHLFSLVPSLPLLILPYPFDPGVQCPLLKARDLYTRPHPENFGSILH